VACPSGHLSESCHACCKNLLVVRFILSGFCLFGKAFNIKKGSRVLIRFCRCYVGYRVVGRVVA